MKYTLLILFPFLFANCQQSATIGQKPDETLERQTLKSIIRYAGKLPPKGANHDNKFDPKFDEYYEKLAQQHRIDLYHQDSKTGDLYLLVSRIAPSLQVKRVATGIHLRMAGDSITYYNEVFRTWKMPEAELAEKGAMLFAKMVKGEDLNPYYPQNSGKEEYIEFPDSKVRFDTQKRRWIVEGDDPAVENEQTDREGE
jgi:hypothetical protein